jgi:hypothetical protein
MKVGDHLSQIVVEVVFFIEGGLSHFKTCKRVLVVKGCIILVAIIIFVPIYKRDRI